MFLAFLTAMGYPQRQSTPSATGAKRTSPTGYKAPSTSTLGAKGAADYGAVGSICKIACFIAPGARATQPI